MLIVLSFCAVGGVLIFAWSAWQIVRILDDRYSYRRARADLESQLEATRAELADAITRAGAAEAEIDKLRKSLADNSAFTKQLLAELKSCRRMIAVKIGRIAPDEDLRNDPRP